MQITKWRCKCLACTALVISMATSFLSAQTQHAPVARVNGAIIERSTVAVPMQRLTAAFEEYFSRKPDEGELAALEELQHKCECWKLCIKVRETAVVKKAMDNLKTDGKIDPEKVKRFEDGVFERAALKDPRVASYLKTRQKQRDPEIEKRVMRQWEMNQIEKAEIEILDDSFKSCFEELGTYLDMPDPRKMIHAHLENMKAEEKDRPH